MKLTRIKTLYVLRTTVDPIKIPSNEKFFCVIKLKCYKDVIVTCKTKPKNKNRNLFFAYSKTFSLNYVKVNKF